MPVTSSVSPVANTSEFTAVDMAQPMNMSGGRTRKAGRATPATWHVAALKPNAQLTSPNESSFLRVGMVGCSCSWDGAPRAEKILKKAGCFHGSDKFPTVQVKPSQVGLMYMGIWISGHTHIVRGFLSGRAHFSFRALMRSSFTSKRSDASLFGFFTIEASARCRSKSSGKGCSVIAGSYPSSCGTTTRR